jgi:hypothetical protein
MMSRNFRSGARYEDALQGSALTARRRGLANLTHHLDMSLNVNVVHASLTHVSARRHCTSACEQIMSLHSHRHGKAAWHVHLRSPTFLST